ncbi:DASH complex subunit Spc34 [Talaromyces proteolyticus]|uniref:DASH complex subunit SPC34 n=1 Tax=Talaromyces proteolyticus TaxID=1131652 RepID=A0AAD4KZJ1_9EURO|nr:DASH complex subunit Spc34 [Talaromyces proteolyticus]KAH8703927.1 DASH complex subunit Spc34 [Talaromyces proteolyticus]
MSLLENHLEQISLSAHAISELSFPPPKRFTNALLNTPDITTLIRDTEVHERALFTLDQSSKPSQRRATRRGTSFPIEPQGETMASRIYAARNNRHQSAVARVLGNDMMDEIKRSTGSSTRAARGEINIDVLLKGAEILCNVYPVPGAPEKISNLRYRYSQITASLEQLEARVAENTAELERINEAYDKDEFDFADSQPQDTQVTDDDIEKELEEIRELERRKRTLEERVTGIERDLGELMR